MVKCKDCGLLGVRDPVTNELVEATERLRRDGDYQTNHTGGPIVPVLICYADVFSPFKGKHRADLLGKISENIDCPHFAKYAAGRNPKDVEKMFFQQTVFELQKQQSELQRHQAEWERKQADQQARLDAFVVEKEDQRHKQNLKMAAITIIGGMLTAVLTAIAIEIVKKLLETN